MSIRRVQQIDVDGCGVACLAMVIGQSYESMLYRVALRKVRQGRTNFAMNHKEIEYVLRRMRQPAERRPFRGWRNIDCDAIVPVFRRKRRFHWVVFVKGRGGDYVLDPWPTRPGRRYDFRGLQARGFYLALDDQPRR